MHYSDLPCTVLGWAIAQIDQVRKKGLSVVTWLPGNGLRAIWDAAPAPRFGPFSAKAAKRGRLQPLMSMQSLGRYGHEAGIGKSVVSHTTW